MRLQKYFGPIMLGEPQPLVVLICYLFSEIAFLKTNLAQNNSAIFMVTYDKWDYK